MSRYKRFIKWLLFGSFPASQPLDALDNIPNSEKKNELTISRIDLIGSFLCNHLFGIPNRTPSTSFEGETGQGIGIGDDAGDFAWRRADYLDADIDSYEIGGSLNGIEDYPSLFNNDEHFYDDCSHGVNPANGLPMLDDCIDIHGNPYGTDNSDYFLCFGDDTDLHAEAGYVSSFDSIDFFDSHSSGFTD